MLLLDKTVVITESNTYIKVPFLVPEGQEKLKISFSYTPKYIENKEKSLELLREGVKKYAPNQAAEDFLDELPLKNFVTLTLDSPLGWAGTAHRHPNVQTHEISSDGSSRGFLTMPVVAGEWAITLAAFYIIEDVTARLEVTCE